MSDVGHKLYTETEAAKTLRAQLADIIAGDDEFAADVVEGQTNLPEAIDAAVARLLDDHAALAGLDEYIKKLAERRDRIKDRIDAMRTALAVALEQAGKKKYEHPAVTISLRNCAPSVTVIDEAAIPGRFWKPGEPRLDKRAVLEALKAREPIPGATLSNGSATLAMKWG